MSLRPRSRAWRCRAARRRCRSTSRCSPLRADASSSRSLSAAADQRVEHHRGEEDRALERVGPVAVPLRIDDAELDHPEHGGAEERADHRAQAAGQQTAADDGAVEDEEYEPDTT